LLTGNIKFLEKVFDVVYHLPLEMHQILQMTNILKDGEDGIPMHF